MAYSKTTWTKRIVQYPDRYAVSDLGGGISEITPSPGSVTQAGTPITEAALNNLETQYDEAVAAAVADLDTHEAATTGIHGVGSDYVAKTTRSDQKPDWTDLQSVPYSKNAYSLGGGFSANQQISVVKFNDLVVITGIGTGSLGALVHSLTSEVTSNAVIPSAARPSNIVSAAFCVETGFVGRILIHPDGYVKLTYLDWTGNYLARDSSYVPPTISYVIT